MKHLYHKCNKMDCQICNGGLKYCIVCKGGEGSLTTDCCGRKLTNEEEERIYHQANLDYKDGKWINKSNYSRSYNNILEENGN